MAGHPLGGFEGQWSHRCGRQFDGHLFRLVEITAKKAVFCQKKRWREDGKYLILRSIGKFRRGLEGLIALWEKIDVESDWMRKIDGDGMELFRLFSSGCPAEEIAAVQ